MNKTMIKKPVNAVLFHTMPVLVFILTLLLTSVTSTAEGADLSTKLKDHLHTLDALVPQDEITDGGRNIPLDDRVVVVTFFASWCPPCLKEFAALNAVLKTVGQDNVTVVAVNVFEEFDNNDETRMANFLETTKPEFLVLKGTDLSRELYGNIKRIPTLLIFDRAGDLAFNFIHAKGAAAGDQAVDDEELLNVIQPLL